MGVIIIFHFLELNRGTVRDCSSFIPLISKVVLYLFSNKTHLGKKKNYGSNNAWVATVEF